MHCLHQPFSYQSRGERGSRWWRKGRFVELLKAKVLVILNAEVLENPHPPSKAIHLLQKPGSVLPLPPFELLHQHSQSVFVKPDQDDVGANLLQIIKECVKRRTLSQTHNMLHLFHQDGWPEEEGVLVLPGHGERLHEVPDQFVVVQVLSQDRRDHWEEDRGIMVSGNSSQLGEVKIGRGGGAEELKVAKNQLGSFHLLLLAATHFKGHPAL